MGKTTKTAQSEASELTQLLCTDHVELKEICDLTVELTKLRQNECKHLSIENYAPEVFEKLIEIAIRYKVLKYAHVMPDWILAKDILPEMEGQYLVCDTSGSVLSAYFEGTQFTKSGAGGFWVVAVVGWMNLPKPLRA